MVLSPGSNREEQTKKKKKKRIRIKFKDKEIGKLRKQEGRIDKIRKRLIEQAEKRKKRIQDQKEEELTEKEKKTQSIYVSSLRKYWEMRTGEDGWRRLFEDVQMHGSMHIMRLDKETLPSVLFDLNVQKAVVNTLQPQVFGTTNTFAGNSLNRTRSNKRIESDVKLRQFKDFANGIRAMMLSDSKRRHGIKEIDIPTLKPRLSYSTPTELAPVMGFHERGCTHELFCNTGYGPSCSSHMDSHPDRVRCSTHSNHSFTNKNNSNVTGPRERKPSRASNRLSHWCPRSLDSGQVR